jgi:hypothetical protein
MVWVIQGWSNRLELPDVLPTFYADDENGTDPRTPIAGNIKIHVLQPPRLQHPPPPPTPPPPSVMTHDMQQQVQKDEAAVAAKKRKRRPTRKRVSVKVEKHDQDDDNDDVDSDVEFVHLSSNTARRILWQRGHAAQLPSAKADIIRRATVANFADAYDPLCQLGFAIIEDMTEVYAPKNRCTREQSDLINKCECALLHRFGVRTHLDIYTHLPIIKTDEVDEGLEYVLEGVTKNAFVDHVVPHYDKETPWPRLQLDPENRAEYYSLYEGQLRDIIEGYDIYEGEEDPISFHSTLASNKNHVHKTRTCLRLALQS